MHMQESYSGIVTYKKSSSSSHVTAALYVQIAMFRYSHVHSTVSHVKKCHMFMYVHVCVIIVYSNIIRCCRPTMLYFV